MAQWEKAPSAEAENPSPIPGHLWWEEGAASACGPLTSTCNAVA